MKTLTQATKERIADLRRLIQARLDEAAMLERADVACSLPDVDQETFKRVVVQALRDAAEKARNEALTTANICDDMERGVAYPPEAFARAVERAGFKRWVNIANELYCLYCDALVEQRVFERMRCGVLQSIEAWQCDRCDVVRIESAELDTIRAEIDLVAEWIGDQVVDVQEERNGA